MNCVRSSYFILLFKYSTSFSIFCSAVTSIIHCGIFKSSTLLLNYQFLPSHLSISLCFMYSYSYMTVIFYVYLIYWPFYLKIPPFFSLSSLLLYTTVFWIIIIAGEKWCLTSSGRSKLLSSVHSLQCEGFSESFLIGQFFWWWTLPFSR